MPNKIVATGLMGGSLPYLLLFLLTQQMYAVRVVHQNSRVFFLEDNHGNILFRGGEVAIFVDGKWCVGTETTAPGTTWRLTLQQTNNIRGDDSTLGPYTGQERHWTCVIDQNKTIPITTSHKNMYSGNSVLFEVSWPEGAPNTFMGDNSTSSLTNYPALQVPSDHFPTTLSWHGSFTQSIRGLSEGTPGGPTVFYNPQNPKVRDVMIGSPWNGNWKDFSAGNNQNWKGDISSWSPGTSGRIQSLPSGYRQSVLLFSGVNGITDTLNSWGKVMRRSRKPKQGRFKLPDVTLEKIGYQTDNGAMYCFCSDPNCSLTLLKEVEYLKILGIPMGYLSFQGAGASSGRGKAAPWCVDTWGVDGGLGKQYPMDLTTFQQALGLPLQLYAPYFCPGSPYFDSGQSKWKPAPSDTSLPGCQSYSFENVKASQSRTFYDWFLDKGFRKAGMASFESDFMNQNHNCVPDFIHQAGGAELWQQGMAGAALAKNVTIQWCYASPTDVLASLDMPSVTNFRVSFDYCYGESWKIGESSLLVWAVGAAPSKDTLWSTANNHTEIPGCKWTPDHEEYAAELHVALSLMSTGPVGLSDAMGFTNATLLKRIIRQDGTLLKPVKPVTAVDSTFLDPGHPAVLAAGAGNGGYVYGTAGVGNSWFFVSFLLPQPYQIKVRDFWPLLTMPLRSNPLTLLAFRPFEDGSGCKNGTDAEASGCVKLVTLQSVDDPSLPVFEVPALDTEKPYAPTVMAVWQACPISGWIILGELDKYVPLSPQRFQLAKCTQRGIHVVVTGSGGETVEVAALKPDPDSLVAADPTGRRYTVVKRTVHIGNAGTSRIFFSTPVATE